MLTKIPNKLKIENVRKSFTNDKVRLQVIEGLDFEVNEGEFVAIVGPSGCGKTTLMNIIAGFLAPDSGGVHIDGVLRNGPNRKGIMITQQGSVFPWLTVKQNLLFALFYNALGVPLAAGVLYPSSGILLSPMIAALAMSLSSVSVVANALRLFKR